MRFPIITVCILSNIIFISAFAQQQGAAVQTNQFGQITNLKDAKSITLIDNVTIYGGDNKIPYSSVKGSKFWHDEWEQGALYKNDKMLGIAPVRLNLVSSQVHVMINDEEKVIDDAITSVIFFKQNDTSMSTAAFISHVPNLFLANKKLDDFVQVLNYGTYQLLKYTERYIVTGDSLFHTLKRYYFSDKVYYFLKSSNRVERVKKLSKENLLVFLPASSSFADWIKTNDIDFKRENDVVRFLNYYNANKQQ